ncbi:MAG: acetylxylan esterase [Planctomycetes bacterium]|nr:acetylxylan esterase [Planctomycetota bacterium]
MPPTFVQYDPSSIVPQDLWSLDRIRTDPLEVRVRHEERRRHPEGEFLLREFFFTSHEFRGEKQRICAHAVFPLGRGPLPAMVHGAGSLDSVEAFARAHNVATLAIDRVGTGDSNGPPDSYNLAWLDLGREMRDGWMVQYVTNTLRAITYLQLQPEVDPARIGVTGGSRGGTMTLIANGVDSRISLALPSATCGDILTAFEHGGWANYLYTREDGRPGIPPLFRIFSVHGDPLNYARTQHGQVVLILGAQDEYFPIYTVKTFCQAVTGDLRLCLVPDWDHGIFSALRPEIGTYDNRVEAGLRTDAAVRWAIQCILHRQRPLPHTPLLSWLHRDGKLNFTCTPDASWPLEGVDLLYSADGAYFFQRLPLEKIYETFRERYVGDLPVTTEDASKLCFYVEARYKDGPFLTSFPELGLAFQQRMRVLPPGQPGPQPDWAFLEEKFLTSRGSAPALLAFDRTRKNAPAVILLAPPESDRFEVTGAQIRAEIERFARRGLFAAGLRAADCSEVEAILELLRSRFGGHVRPDAMSLVGYSLGAALALECAIRLSGRIRAAVAFAPACDAARAQALAADAGNLDSTRVFIFSDLEDPAFDVGQGFAHAAAAKGRANVRLFASHPTDGLRWRPGWPEAVPGLRRAEEKFFGVLTAS